MRFGMKWVGVAVVITLLVLLSGISSAQEEPRASAPIGTGSVRLDENFVFAGGFELGAFVPTGTDGDTCLVTLRDSDFAIAGTTVYCSGEQFDDGQLGIWVHVFLPVPAPEDFVMFITVYQEFARGYGQPTPFI